MARKTGLGRGMAALMGDNNRPAVRVETTAAGPSTTEDAESPVVAEVSSDTAADPIDGELHSIPLDLLRRGKYQPRREFDPEALEELASSIRVQGVIQPIVVRPLITGKGYEIVAGERRWRAAQRVGLQSIPAVVKRVADRDAMAMALIENIQRERLNPIEEASALQRLISEFDLTQQQVAEAVGRSRTAVTNLLRLLNLNADVGRMVELGKLEMGHARALLALEGKMQFDAANQVMLLGLSVRETEKLVKRLLQPTAKESPKSTVEVDPDVKRLQDSLSERLGAQVSIQQGAKGRGKLVIRYHSLDELEGILDHIR